IANPRQTHALAHHLESRLRIAEGIVASPTTKAGIARIFLTCSHATEERLEGQVHPHCHVLQDLAVYRGQTGTLLLKVWQCSLLVVQTGTSARLLIRCLAFFKKVVVQPATLIKNRVHDCLLSRCRIQAVLECFTHTLLYGTKG